LPPSTGASGGASSGGSGGDRNRTIAAGAVVAALALVAVLAVSASGMLSGGGASQSPVASVAVVASVAPSAAPSLAPSASPSVAPSPTAAPTATPVPTPTPTPAGRQARIGTITLSGSTYVVTWQAFGYKPALPGRHVHFFFDTVKPVNAGIPGKGPWFVYAGPNPFKGYKVSDRPAGATQMCILVANADHSVNQNTGNCVDLP
jgi:hypothetical protein